MDETALFTLSYGVFILTTEVNGKKNGCVINTLSQVTQEPIMVSITVLKQNLTHDLVKESNKFAVSVLGKKSSLDIIKHFGYGSGRDIDKFENMEYVEDSLKNPVVKKEAIATMSCKVVKTIDFPTHTMFIAEVVEAEKLKNEEPMTYAYYRDLKSGKAIQNSDTDNSNEEVKPIYQCKVCHYIYEGDIPFEELPDDYVCPICHEPKSAFIRIN